MLAAAAGAMRARDACTMRCMSGAANTTTGSIVAHAIAQATSQSAIHAVLNGATREVATALATPVVMGPE
jgi:hypothetical protein